MDGVIDVMIDSVNSKLILHMFIENLAPNILWITLWSSSCDSYTWNVYYSLNMKIGFLKKNKKKLIYLFFSEAEFLTFVNSYKNKKYKK